MELLGLIIIVACLALGNVFAIISTIVILCLLKRKRKWKIDDAYYNALRKMHSDQENNKNFKKEQDKDGAKSQSRPNMDGPVANVGTDVKKEHSYAKSGSKPDSIPPAILETTTKKKSKLNHHGGSQSDDKFIIEDTERMKLPMNSASIASGKDRMPSPTKTSTIDSRMNSDPKQAGPYPFIPAPVTPENGSKSSESNSTDSTEHESVISK